MNSARWHKDPYGQHSFRYWDGFRWTAYVGEDGNRNIGPERGVNISDGRRAPVRARDQEVWRPGYSTILLALLLSMTTMLVIVVGSYLVLRAMGLDEGPPWWLKGAALGAASSVAYLVFAAAGRKPRNPRSRRPRQGRGLSRQ
jgi:hypothetical protein